VGWSTVVLVLRLTGCWPRMRLRIRAHCCSDGTAQSATYDGSFATAHFVAYGGASSAPNATAYGCIHGGIARVCRGGEKGCRQERISNDGVQLGILRNNERSGEYRPTAGTDLVMALAQHQPGRNQFAAE
jgi:hypothetical protein